MHALWQSTNQEHVDDMDKAVNVQIYLQILCLRHSAKYKHTETRLSVHTAAEWSHLRALCVDLRDVCDALAHHVNGDVVAVLVAPVGRLVSRPLNL